MLGWRVAGGGAKGPGPPALQLWPAPHLPTPPPPETDFCRLSSSACWLLHSTPTRPRLAEMIRETGPPHSRAGHWQSDLKNQKIHVLTCYFKRVGSWKEGRILGCGLFTKVLFQNTEWHPFSQTKQQQNYLIGGGVIWGPVWALGPSLCFAYSLEQRNIYSSWVKKFEDLCPRSGGLPSNAPGMAIVSSGRADQLEHSMAFVLEQERPSAAQDLVL